MNKIIVFKNIAIDKWRYNRKTKTKSTDSYLSLYREVEIPFIPYIGLQLSMEYWNPEPLATVRYDIDDNRFICHVIDDNEIPDKLDPIMKEMTDEEIDIFLSDEYKLKKKTYKNRGWLNYRDHEDFV